MWHEATNLTKRTGRSGDRLYVAGDLGERVAVTLDEGQTHYLLHVLRAKAGNLVSLFNGRDGEWLAEIAGAAKRGVTATAENRRNHRLARRISGWPSRR